MSSIATIHVASSETLARLEATAGERGVRRFLRGGVDVAAMHRILEAGVSLKAPHVVDAGARVVLAVLDYLEQSSPDLFRRATSHAVARGFQESGAAALVLTQSDQTSWNTLLERELENPIGYRAFMKKHYDAVVPAGDILDHVPGLLAALGLQPPPSAIIVHVG